ncbi:MAG: ORF6N domain-containing protein [Bacteroidetes bacterium]|nr:ORF6N domain-containing protein [Bacteroidota bacterium]
MSKHLIISDEQIINKIYFIRGQKVMLDNDLAKLYGVSTGRLNEQVKRNGKRFPDDFMFQLSKKELQNLMSQFAISRWGGIRKMPYVFTEQGVAMLSSVLNSETAIDVNIKIIRIFTKMRELLSSHKDVLLKLEQLEKKLIKQDARTNKHEDEIGMLFEAIKQLVTPQSEPRKSIGYKLKGEE